MNQTDLRIDQDRLWLSLENMALIGATGRGGCDRQALTDVDKAGRDLFVQWATDAGCEVRVDAIGNIFARRPGSDLAAAPVLVGSHLDTQKTGGRFDGVYGVLSGLEAVRVLNEAGVATRRPIELVSWTNEEGCRFAPAMLGSGVVSGDYDLAFAYDRQDSGGLRLGDELARIGYRGETPAAPRPIHAAFELHIEQGPILEWSGSTIGVVTGIQGAYWFDLTLTGVSSHAGPTPMEMRRDPWRAGAPIITSALDLAVANGPWGRCTIGNVRATPGARNTTPETLTISIDIRHPERERLEAMVAQLKQIIDVHCRTATIDWSLEQVWRMAPTTFDPDLVALVEQTAGELGYRHERIVSGAGHDSLHVARFAPTTMIFVPCAGGLSHNEAENASPGDLAAGANVLLRALLSACA